MIFLIQKHDEKEALNIDAEQIKAQLDPICDWILEQKLKEVQTVQPGECGELFAKLLLEYGKFIGYFDFESVYKSDFESVSKSDFESVSKSDFESVYKSD